MKDTNDNKMGHEITIPRPMSLLVGPSSQLRAPSSLLSSALPPSLLQGSRTTTASGIGEDAILSSSLPRPRRLWHVRDHSLKRLPPGYPPLNPTCSVFVGGGDVSPSIVAVRISECLRKRSVSVEYDEETNTATALTVDRCMFQVQLYKGGNPEFFVQPGVIVECQKLSSSRSMTFHRTCRAILKAALGQSTGDDTRRRFHQCHGREFQHLSLTPSSTSSSHETINLLNPDEKDTVALKPQAIAAQALEEAFELTQKDRLDTQLLGMERFVNLTSPSICGKDIALYMSRQLIQKDPEWILSRVKPSSSEGNLEATTVLDHTATVDEGRHASEMRAMAVRVLCNSLMVLEEARLLAGILVGTDKSSQSHPCLEQAFLDCLLEDLKGVERPPSIVQAGTNTLASIHESVLAIRILRILGQHSGAVRALVQSDRVMDRLEMARAHGRSAHMVLQQEAELACAEWLTEDFRSC